MKNNLRAALKFFLLSLVTVVYLGFSSSAQKVHFKNSTVAPAAEGGVKIKKDKNGNYDIEVSIDNLADSKKLTPPKNAYVVWVDTKESGTKSIGQIHSSGSMFSKAKKASITGVSTAKPTKVYITAEDDPNTGSPGDVVVLTTDSF
jgi:hypothetical protein